MILLDELEEVRFCQSLDPDSLQHIAQLAEPQEYPPGRLLFKEGHASSYIYLLLQGSVTLEIEQPGKGSTPIETIQPGELLGWSPVLGRGAMTATARTASRCRVAGLDVGQVLRLSERDPRFGLELLRGIAATIADRLLVTRLQLLKARSAACSP
jgi:CRP-like cAMP-binding protein